MLTPGMLRHSYLHENTRHMPIKSRRKSQEKFRHQLSLMTKNPSVKYEHVIRWMPNEKVKISIALLSPHIFHVFAFISEQHEYAEGISLVSKNSNKAGKSIRIEEAYEKMTERFISCLSQPAFISAFPLPYDFSESHFTLVKLR